MTDKVTIERKTLQAALGALTESIDLVQHDYTTDWRHGMPTRKAQLDASELALNQHRAAIDALRAALAAQTVEPVAWRINTLEGVGLPANWHYFDDEPGGSAFTVQPLYVAPPSPADLIPQDKLFVCGQMGAHVTRVRVEQPAAVPLTDETRKTLDSLIEHVWAFYDIMEDGPDESDEAMATDHFVKAINIIRNHRAMIAAAGEPSHD